MKDRLKRNIIPTLILVCFITGVNAQTLPEFKNKDKICFIGNSITQDGRYHMLLHAFFVNQFPGIQVEFHNCGISGDVADGMLNRLDKDILSHKPNYAFLMVGMNDIQRYLYAEGIVPDSTILANRQNALNNYYTKTEKIAALLVENDVQPIFMTPSIYDQTAKIDRVNDFGCNDALANCAIHIRKLAKKHNAPLVDLHPLMKTINLKMQARDSSYTIIGPDRIHPGDIGHFIMAYEIISTVMPTDGVSKIVLDAKERKNKQSVNCEIKIDANSPSIEFKVLQKSLPFPVTKRFDGALDLVPFQNEINRDMLLIQRLKKGNYELQIDNITIGTFSSELLKEGINLSDYSATPQYQQAIQIFKLCEQYHKIYGQLRNISLIEFKNLKNYTGPNTMKDKRAYLDKEIKKQEGKTWYAYFVKTCEKYFELKPKEEELWIELGEIRTEIFNQNQPNWHEYKLVKIK